MAKKLTSNKAKEILTDGEVHGYPLTDKQKRFFGAIAGGAPIKPKSNGWLNKFDDGGPIQENYNDYSVSAPEGFQGDGFSNVGRNYSPAWGGQFAMGGSLPGAVGFTYARTQGAAPSNGPYAKKTLPSAQNGQEMKYYQEGLDWQPKMISKNGGWLSKFADGGEEKLLPKIGSKEAYELEKARQNRTDAIPSRGKQKEQAILQNLGQSKIAAQEATRVAANRESLSQYTPKEGDAEHRRIMAQKYAAEHGGYSDEQGNYHQGLLGDAADSRIANRTWENIIEPGINAEMVMSGAGLLGKGAKSLGKYAGRNIAESMESGILSNTYKLNPWAYKVNPEAFYRQIGNTGLTDALESGVIKSADQTTFPRPYFVEGKDFKMLESTGSGAHGKPSVIFETSGINTSGEPTMFPAHVNSGYTPWVANAAEVPISEGRILQKDWLRGYKGIDTPKQLPSSSNIPILKRNVIYPSPNKPLPNYMEPFLGKVKKPISKDEKIFRSSFTPETRAKMEANDWIYFDANGNIISPNQYLGDIEFKKGGWLDDYK